jgi:hypothetical protein
VESLPSKRRILEKNKRSKDWKAKEVKPHLKSSTSPKREKKKRG